MYTKENHMLDAIEEMLKKSNEEHAARQAKFAEDARASEEATARDEAMRESLRKKPEPQVDKKPEHAPVDPFTLPYKDYIKVTRATAESRMQAGVPTEEDKKALRKISSVESTPNIDYLPGSDEWIQRTSNNPLEVKLATQRIMQRKSKELYGHS